MCCSLEEHVSAVSSIFSRLRKFPKYARLSKQNTSAPNIDRIFNCSFDILHICSNLINSFIYRSEKSNTCLIHHLLIQNLDSRFSLWFLYHLKISSFCVQGTGHLNSFFLLLYTTSVCVTEKC